MYAVYIILAVVWGTTTGGIRLQVPGQARPNHQQLTQDQARDAEVQEESAEGLAVLSLVIIIHISPHVTVCYFVTVSSYCCQNPHSYRRDRNCVFVWIGAIGSAILPTLHTKIVCFLPLAECFVPTLHIPKFCVFFLWPSVLYSPSIPKFCVFFLWPSVLYSPSVQNFVFCPNCFHWPSVIHTLCTHPPYQKLMFCPNFIYNCTPFITFSSNAGQFLIYLHVNIVLLSASYVMTFQTSPFHLCSC